MQDVFKIFFFDSMKKILPQCLPSYLGEDDDDFETNYMIDRHLQICYLYVDMVSILDIVDAPRYSICPNNMRFFKYMIQYIRN